MQYSKYTTIRVLTPTYSGYTFLLFLTHYYRLHTTNMKFQMVPFLRAGHILSTLRCFIYRILLYLICCFTVLVPQQLIEFRYYIIPFLIFRIHIPKPHDWRLTASLCCELALFSAINAVTMYLFLYRPFQWPHLPGQTQRFMW